MPDKKGRSTPQEAKFVKAYVAYGDAQLAAREAGYAHPGKAAYGALARPAIQDAIKVEQAARLNNELLPLAVKAIERVLTDAKTPAGAVVQAAKLVFDRTLGAQDGGQRKDPAEMTGEELQRAIEQLRREASERAQVVIDVKPDPAPPQDVMG